MRAERLAERTEANVATASTSVPPAVASEEIVAQSAIRLSAGERRRALLDERGGALEEVLGPSERVLELGLEVELGVEVAVDELVQRPL